MAEDHRFWMHRGVDHVAFFRAVASCLRGKRQGGSTIEQQLVRVISEDYRITFRRKLKEMALAVRVADILNKENALGLYLHIAYLGKDADGVVALTERYGFKIDEISLERAAEIASCLKYPMAPNESIPCRRRRALRVAYTLERLHAVGMQHEIEHAEARTDGISTQFVSTTRNGCPVRSPGNR